MKVKKIEVTVKIEVLSIDSVYGILMDVANQYRQEKTSGKLCADDGDQVWWETYCGKEQEI